MYNSRNSNLTNNEGEQIGRANLLVVLSGETAGQGNSSESWEAGACAWSADGRYFAWSCSHRFIKIVPQTATRQGRNIVNDANNDEAVMVDAGEKVCCMAFSSHSCSEGKRQANRNIFRYHVIEDVVLAVGLRNGRIRTWDAKTGCLLLELSGHTGTVSHLSFAADGSFRLASASHDSTVKIWDFEEEGHLVKTLQSNAKTVYGCSWSPLGKMLASTGDLKTVELWNMEAYSLICRLKGHHNIVSKCDFSPDGSLLATSSFDSRVIVWDVLRAVPIIELCHLQPTPSLIYAGGSNGASVFSVSFSPDGKHVASLCEDGLVRVWDIFDPCCPIRIVAVEDPSFCCFSPKGTSLAVETKKGKVLIFESPTNVTSLQHICRLVIRRFTNNNDEGILCMIPKMLQKFLKYEQL